MKKHAMLVIKEKRLSEKPVKQHVYEHAVAQWLQRHNKGVVTAVASGHLSDTAKLQMRDCFKEL